MKNRITGNGTLTTTPADGHYLSLFGGLAIGIVLGLLGGGGALMAIPVLIYLLQYPFRTAVAGSLVLVVVGTLPAMALYWRARQIDWVAAGLMGLGGAVGAFLGSRFSTAFQKEWLLGILIVLMAVSAWKLLGPNDGRLAAVDGSGERRYSHLLAAGLGVGILTGLVGVGGGFLLVPALFLFADLSARRAVATSLVVIGLNAVAGAIGYQHILPWNQVSFWWLVAGSALGSVSGFLMAARLSDRQIRRGFGLLLVGLVIVLLVFPPSG